jgi:phosphoribosyl 1,2-cyclic phosphodiesterase
MIGMTQPPDTTPQHARPDGATAGLCVLASGSRGNCSVLVIPEDGTRRVVLIDAGLSPRRTRRLLADLGIDLWEIDAIVLTHLDSDHAHLGWAALERLRAPFYVHAAHRGRAERLGLSHHRTTIFRDTFRVGRRLQVEPELLEHDSLGVVVFRMTIDTDEPDRQAVISYATDVGRPSDALARHIEQADVLAIESNYCPVLQRTSGRPAYLQRRIMGGCGHLSNDQCLDLVRGAAPRGEVVCLHLSQQCNHPDLVRSLHADAPYRLTITDQHRRTDWVWLRPSGRRTPRRPATPLHADLPLWADGVGA